MDERIDRESCDDAVLNKREDCISGDVSELPFAFRMLMDFRVFPCFLPLPNPTSTPSPGWPQQSEPKLDQT